MKIGIMADSHDNLPMISRALELFQREGTEVIIHAGDFVAPFAVKLLLRFPGKVCAVFGNNDGEKQGIQETGLDVQSPPRRLALGGRTFIIAHRAEQLENVSSGADVLVFGHSHRASIEGRSPLLVNPGECGGWLTGSATAAVLDTRLLEVRIVKLRQEGGSE